MGLHTPAIRQSLSGQRKVIDPEDESVSFVEFASIIYRIAKEICRDNFARDFVFL